MRTENDYTETDLGNISPNPRGEYDEKASYEYLDLISYQGGSYLCLAEPKTIVSGIAPKAGQNTEVWQMIALPGDLTSEYIAMHDDTIAKAKQTEASRTAAELAQEAAETARTDVVQMHSETLQAATEARENCDSSAGYAQAAEVSRKAAAESEQNINAQVTGFETEVSESVTQATEQIATARQKAVQTITSQQDTSVQAVKDQTAAYISEKNTEAKKEITDHAEQEIVRINAQDSVQQIQKNKEDVALLKEDISDLKTDVQNAEDALTGKISKFYATNNGENHLADSDDGKIADMMVYGKSEQKKYQGYQLLEHNTSEYNFTATTSYYGLVDNASENIKSGAYYLRKLGNTPTVLITFLNASKKMVKQEYLTDGSEKRIVFETDVAYVKYIIQNLTAGTDYKGTVKLILASTSGADYEPYVGGIPSPNPDYPQEIKSVVNPTIKVYGKNLFDSSKISNYMNGLTCKKNSDGSITVTGSSKRQVQFVYQTIFTAGTYFISFKSVGKATSGNNISYYVRYRKDGNEKYPSNKFTLKQDTEVTIGIYYYDAVTDANQTAWLQIEKGSVATPYEPYKEQSIQLPYTLNAVPVNSGGNVTIDGQQYVADYVDVERGRVVRNIENVTFNGAENENWILWNENEDNLWSFMFQNSIKAFVNESASKCNRFEFDANESTDRTFWLCNPSGNPSLQIKNRIIGKDITAFKSWLSNNPIDVIYPLRIPIEEELTAEHAQALKELATYYPVTNISIGSEQLDGYTVFNYPISMANGWNYVKQQLDDNRDYIYDMDSRTQDIDTQSAEAYVNSEYAVALTELEV